MNLELSSGKCFVGQSVAGTDPSVALFYACDKWNSYQCQWRSLNTEKSTHIKGRLQDQAMVLFNCVPFQMGTSLKGKNLLPEGANSFLYEQFLIVSWKITFITLSDLPLMLLFLLRTCVTSVMGAMPMTVQQTATETHSL